MNISPKRNEGFDDLEMSFYCTAGGRKNGAVSKTKVWYSVPLKNNSSMYTLNNCMLKTTRRSESAYIRQVNFTFAQQAVIVYFNAERWVLI